MRLFQFLQILLFSVLLYSCGGSSDIQAKLNQADSLMVEHPDSSFSLLKGIPKSDLHSKALKAKYALLFTEAQYKNYEEFENDSLIDIAERYYEKKGERRDYGKSLMYKGVVLYDMMDYNGAMDAYKRAEEVLIPLEDNYLLGLINTRIGELYGHVFADGDLVIEVDKRAAHYFHKDGNAGRENRAYSSLGVDYVLMNEKDSAFHYLNKSIELSKQSNDSDMLIYDYYLLLSLFNKNGEYEKAKELGAYVMKEWKGYDINNVLYNLSESYARLGQIDSARYCYGLIERDSIMTLADYVSLSDIEECAGNYKLALEYERRGNAIADSTVDARSRQRVLEVEKRFDYQKILNRNQYIQYEYKMAVLTFLLIGVVLVVIIVSLIIVVRRKQLQILNDKSSMDQLRADFDRDKSNLLMDKGDAEMRWNAVLDRRLKTLDDLIDLSYRYEKFEPSFFDGFKKIINVGKDENDTLSDITDVVNLKYNGIISHLTEKHPNLSNDDIHFISLLCIGFSSATICAFFAYKSTSAVYVRKCRLAEKMKLDMSLNNYLSAIKQKYH